MLNNLCSVLLNVTRARHPAKNIRSAVTHPYQEDKMTMTMLRALLCGGYEDYLRRAAADGHEKRLQKLLKRGVLPDPKQQSHESALQLAVQNGHMACVKALLDAGADVNRVSNSTPLLDAAAHGHMDIIKLLLDHKANPNAAVDGNTAVHMAARFGHQEVIEHLASIIDVPKAVTAANSQGKIPLALASSQSTGGEAVVKYLLSAGSDPAAADVAGNTALHHAAISGNAPVAQILLTKSPKDVCVVNSQGRTPLHLAAAFGKTGVVNVLMREKPDLSIKDKDGSTVLHLVAKCLMCNKAGQVSMAKAMIQAGADPAAVDEAGNTAAHYTSFEEVKEALASTAQPAPTAAGPISMLAPEEAVLATSNSGAASSTSEVAAKAAPTKAEKLAQGLASTIADEPQAPDNWVVKQALRSQTSEGVDGWKLGTSVDATQ